MTQPQQPIDAFWEQLSAPFPPPPPFWKYFTTTNLDRRSDLQSRQDFDPASLPYELVVLQPPPPPTLAESFNTFGSVHYLTPRPTLPPEHEELLFRTEDLTKATGTARPHARLLWQLTKSLNLNFLELFTIMADNPVDYLDKVNDIGMLMENINAVLNLLRPHQAREQLKTMLLNRLDAGNEELQRCDEMKQEIEDFLKRVEQADMVEASDSYSASHANQTEANAHPSKTMQKSWQAEKARAAWAILDTLEGD